MANLIEKINAEMENITVVLRELEKVKDKPNKTNLELAGIATYLHNFYMGIENILKQIVISKRIPIPSTETWHRDLLMIATNKGVITEHTQKQLAKYLAFRHFFTHAYGFLLDEAKLKPLVDNVFEMYILFKKEIDDTLSKDVGEQK
ncbi:MAG: hypothetical protein AB1779_00715 [Candidatus Thermoplasmatota archaeon]